MGVKMRIKRNKGQVVNWLVYLDPCGGTGKYKSVYTLTESFCECYFLINVTFSVKGMPSGLTRIIIPFTHI